MPEARGTATDAGGPAAGSDVAAQVGRGWFVPGLLLALAVVLRLIYILDYRAHSLYWEETLLDATVYNQWARGLAAGETVMADVFPLPPLYPYALAALYRIVGAVPAVAYLLQAGLGIVATALFWNLGSRLFGRRAGWLAALLATLYGPLMFMETKLMNTTLGLVLLLLGLRLLLAAAAGDSRRLWAAAGSVLGLTALCRPEALLLLALSAGWSWRRGHRHLMTAALLAAGAAAVLLPVYLRNARVSGEWSPAHLISSQGAITFYQSNNERAAGLYVALRQEGFSGDPLLQAQEERRIAEQRLGRSLTRAQAGRYWLGRSLAWIGSHPLDFLTLEGMKLLRLAGSYEYSTEYIFQVERRQVWSLWLASLPFGFLAALGGLGLLRLLRAGWGPEGLLLALWLAGSITAVMVFYVSSRYRVPVAAMLILLAAYELDHLGRALRRRPMQPGVWGRLAVAAVITCLLLLPVDSRHLAQESDAHHNTGVLHQQRDEIVEALAEFSRAIALRQDHWRAHFAMGMILEGRGDRDAAVAAYRQALRYNRRLSEARHRLNLLGALP